MARNIEWKRTERNGAAMFGANRTPLSGGMSRHTGSDTLHPRLYIEIKRDKRLNAALNRLVKDTILSAAAEEKTPLLMFKFHGQKGFMLLLRSGDLMAVAREYMRARASEEKA